MGIVKTKSNEEIWLNDVNITHQLIDSPPNNIVFPTHWHKGFELLFIESGELHAEVNNKKFVARAGDTVIVNPRHSHAGYTTDGRLLYHVLLFDITPLCEHKVTHTLLEAHLKGNAFFLPLVHDEELTVTAHELFKVQKQGNPNDALLRISLLYRLLFLLRTRHQDVSFRLPSNYKRMQKVIDYVEEHYCENISPRSLSEMFGYEETYFSRLFKSATSLRPTEYIRVLRLEKAQRMLKHQTGSIASIAEACGFGDLNYFSRCFKARYGITANQYRKNAEHK